VSQKSKNRAQLPENKNEGIESILIKITKEIQKSLDKYHNPKKYAEKTLRVYDSNVIRAANLLMLCSLSIDTGEKLTPKQIKNKLPQGFKVNSRQLNEALKKVKKEGFFDKVEGLPKHRGKHKASENIFYEREGGRPSYYAITEGLTELKKIMSYSQAAQLVHNRLRKDGIIQEYYKLLLLAGFYAMKIEGKANGKIFEDVKLSAPLYISQISEDDFSLWEKYVNLILSKDDNELDLMAWQLASMMAENNPFDSFIYLLKVLPKHEQDGEI
jgi:hypothetical protein